MKPHSFRGINVGWIAENDISLPEIDFESHFFSIYTFFTCLEKDVENYIGLCRSDFNSHGKAGEELERLFLNYCGYLKEICGSAEKIKLLDPKTKQEIDLQTGCYLYSESNSELYTAFDADVYFNDFNICNIHLYSYGFPVKKSNHIYGRYIESDFFLNNKSFSEFGNLDYSKLVEFNQIVPRVVARFKYFTKTLLEVVK